MFRLITKHKLVLAATLLIGFSISLAFCLRGPSVLSQWWANNLREQLQQSNPPEMDFYASQLLALGESGWRVLANATHDERPEVRDAARRSFTQALEAWRALPQDISASRVSLLARILNEESRSAGADGIHFYADIAIRLLQWPTTKGDLDRVYHCEQIVRAARTSGWPKARDEEAEPENVSVAQATTAPAAEPVRFSDVEVPQLELPNEQRTQASISSTEEPQLKSAQSPVAAPQAETPRMAPPPLKLPVIPDALPVADASISPNETDREPEWSRLELREIIPWFHDGAMSPKAEKELQRRGFDRANMRVAHAAADRSVENRVKLIHLLPGLSGVDTVGWLLFLARDESPQVRSRAIQVLSTMNDPNIRRQLRELDDTETDEAVRTALQRAQSPLR